MSKLCTLLLPLLFLVALSPSRNCLASGTHRPEFRNTPQGSSSSSKQFTSLRQNGRENTPAKPSRGIAPPKPSRDIAPPLPSRRIAPPLPSRGITPPTHGRGMWLWTTEDVINDLSEQNTLIAMSHAANISEIFAYLRTADYLTHEPALRKFIAKLNQAGIQVWGMEGYRGYFSDSYGPANLYAAVDALISFNSRVSPNERFSGFHSDLEPQDGQGEEFLPTFHNELPDSALSRNGGGVWHVSQVLDREALMQDWIQIYNNLKMKTRPAGIRFGAAMPSWTDDYYGDPVLVTYNGIRRPITHHMMNILDDYVVMSYNTNPANAANRVLSKLVYADTLPRESRPRIYGALETHTGVGSGISYGDTAGKNSKAAVMNDIAKINAILNSHPSYCGMALHDWVGWMNLKAN